MTQLEIDNTLKDFFFKKEELDKRSVFEEFAQTLSNIIVDDFSQNYLLPNPEFSTYLSNTDTNRLLKNTKELISFILTAKVDEEYVKKILDIGKACFTIKFKPSKISYVFWAISEILDKVSQVNTLVKENKSFILKIFRFIEHLINTSFYLEKDRKYKDSLENQKSFNAQNDLYLAFQFHKQNMKKIEQSLDPKEGIRVLDNIQEKSDKCALGKLLKTLIDDNKYQYILGLDIDHISKLHDNWHKEFVNFKEASKTNNKEEMLFYKEKIAKLTDELKSILDSALQDSLKDGHTALNSGIKAIKNITELFQNKTEYSDFDTMFNSTIENTFSEFHWAIEDIYINFSQPADDSYAIKTILNHESQNIFVAIKLKDTQNNEYINKMITILIEILDLHLGAKEREAALISFADKAEHANKSKDMFLSNMSHELRTPLNAITGFSQIIMMKKDTPETIKNYISKINIAGKNLLDLVNTILDFAKLEAGKMQFSPKLNNILNILNEVKTLVSPLASKKDITLKIPKISSLNLYIDDKLFKQVLINLLTNAIKFTPNGGEVSLSIIYDSKTHRYQFEVKDNGIGLSKESISKLFQAFSQVENSYQKVEQGTGLGLMISKKIIESLHKGKIWVESEEGKGSSFIFNMPTPIVESHTYTIEVAPKGSKTVLIVEDSTSYQNLLSLKLQDDMNLVFTNTVNKAKSLLSKNTYDCLILDYFLTDGISSEILNFMEEEQIKIPTIVISSEDEIFISSSLNETNNLKKIINKDNIDLIYKSIKGEINA